MAPCSVPCHVMDQFETMTDTALVFAVARFEQGALTEIYYRHGGSVIALAARLLNSQTLGEEVAQEIFLKLWNDPSRYNPDRGSLRSFLLASTHSRAIDFIRSESARRRREDREARQHMIRGEAFDREIAALTTAEYVRQALNELSEGERGAIELAYFEGLTYKEVAVALNEPEGTVKSRIRAGLQKLSARLVEVE